MFGPPGTCLLVLAVTLSDAENVCPATKGSGPERSGEIHREPHVLQNQNSIIGRRPTVYFERLFTLSDSAEEFGLTFSPDARLLASARGRYAPEGRLTVWDMSRQTRAQTITGDEISGVPAPPVAFLPSGRLVVTATRTPGKLVVWSLETGQPVRSLVLGRNESIDISRLAVSPDGNTIVCGARAGLAIWRWREGRHRVLLWEGRLRNAPQPAERFPVECRGVCYSKKGQVVAAAVNKGGLGGRIVLLDPESWEVKGEISAGRLLVYSFAMAPEGDLVAAELGRGEVAVWDLATFRERLRGKLFDDATIQVAFTNDGQYLLAAGIHEHIMQQGSYKLGVWDVTTGRVVGSLAPPNTRASIRIALSPNDETLVVGGATIELYAMRHNRAP